MDGDSFYSEFLTSSSWFYIRLKLLKLHFENAKIEKEEVKVPFFTLLKFYKISSEHLQPLRLS
jgi:hypothetical protein